MQTILKSTVIQFKKPKLLKKKIKKIHKFTELSVIT